LQLVAFRANTRGNPKTITIIVRQTAGQVTNPAGSPAFLTASPTSDATCRVRADTNVNLRSGPGINYDAICTPAVWSTAFIVGTTQDRSWWAVNANGLSGWVSAAFTTQLGVCANIILVPIPPSPTVAPGQPAFVPPPTFTPLPLLPSITPSSTI